MAGPQTVSLRHPSLGTLRGVAPSSDVAQFLGLKYASLKDRFSRGELAESSPTAVIDATAHGPLPVANPANCDVEHLLLQHALPHPEYRFSDTDCLTLNISVPSSIVETAAAASSSRPLLPVLVFVHGGGFATGSANWPQWDLAPLVTLSIQEGTPIVAVGINYRLGAFGFLTSDAMRQAGYLPNNGLHDQRLGLRWVQRFIEGFGGDPSRVTYLGSSIGGTSGFFHLQSPERLFTRLVALGGSPLLHPIPPFVAEAVFQSAVQGLGLASLSPEEQVRALLALPAAELEEKTRAVAPLTAVVDDDIVRGMASYGGLADAAEVARLHPAVEWVREVMVGHSEFDGMILGITALGHRTDDWARSLSRSLKVTFGLDPDAEPSASPTSSSAKQVSSVISLYNLDDASATAAAAEAKKDIAEVKRLGVLHFLNDLAFAEAAIATARAWTLPLPPAGAGTPRSFLTHFHCPNPWPGPYTGSATHALDAAFALQNYDAYLPQGQRACAERMGRDLVLFVDGKRGDPFPPLGADETGAEMVYFAQPEGGKGDESAPVPTAQAKTEGRRGKLAQVTGGSPEFLDKLMAALGLFLQGPQ